MKILTLSNFYPPYEVGGESLSCKSIVDGLRRRGHSICVLTSDFKSNKCSNEIYRELKLEMDFVPLWNSIKLIRGSQEIIIQNNEILIKHIHRFNPDLIFICNMWNIPRQLPNLAEKLFPNRVVYRFGSYWPILPSQVEQYWNTPGRSWITSYPKKILKWIASKNIEKSEDRDLSHSHVVCISQSVLDEFTKVGIIFPDVRIIHNGIDINRFDFGSSIWIKKSMPKRINLLYLGRLAHEKGVHTAIEALALIIKSITNVRLTIIGSGDKSYEKQLSKLAASLKVSSYITFIKKIPYVAVPEILVKHHILLVPSIWPEPFGRVILEGMASGLVVIGTNVGGMGTVLKNRNNSLVFDPNDAMSLRDRVCE